MNSLLMDYEASSESKKPGTADSDSSQTVNSSPSSSAPSSDFSSEKVRKLDLSSIRDSISTKNFDQRKALSERVNRHRNRHLRELSNSSADFDEPSVLFDDEDEEKKIERVASTWRQYEEDTFFEVGRLPPQKKKFFLNSKFRINSQQQLKKKKKE